MMDKLMGLILFIQDTLIYIPEQVTTKNHLRRKLSSLRSMSQLSGSHDWEKEILVTLCDVRCIITGFVWNIGLFIWNDSIFGVRAYTRRHVHQHVPFFALPLPISPRLPRSFAFHSPRFLQTTNDRLVCPLSPLYPLLVSSALLVNIMSQHILLPLFLALVRVVSAQSSLEPLASKHFTWPDIPYQVTGDEGGERGPQSGFNLCNSTTENQSSECQVSPRCNFCLVWPLTDFPACRRPRF